MNEETDSVTWRGYSSGHWGGRQKEGWATRGAAVLAGYVPALMASAQ